MTGMTARCCNLIAQLKNRHIYVFLCACLFMSNSAGAVRMPVALVHTWYAFEQPGPFTDLDIFLTWQNEPVVNSHTGVYAGFGFWFENGVVAYFGTQIDGDGKKAIFSIWDVDTTKITTTPTWNCKRFDHEGAGTQCIIAYNWIAGHEYRLRLVHKGRDHHMERWQTSIMDMTNHIETPVGVIELSDTRGYSGYGLISAKTKFVNWIEYYGHEQDCAALPLVRVRWRGPYANDMQFTASRATATFSIPECLNSNIYSSGAPLVTLESGAATLRSVVNHKSLWPAAAQ